MEQYYNSYEEFSAAAGYVGLSWFIIKNNKLYVPSTGISYPATEVRHVATYVVDSDDSDPAGRMIIYVLEIGGSLGSIVNGWGSLSESGVNQFIELCKNYS